VLPQRGLPGSALFTGTSPCREPARWPTLTKASVSQVICALLTESSTGQNYTTELRLEANRWSAQGVARSLANLLRVMIESTNEQGEGVVPALEGFGKAMALCHKELAGTKVQQDPHEFLVALCMALSTAMDRVDEASKEVGVQAVRDLQAAGLAGPFREQATLDNYLRRAIAAFAKVTRLQTDNVINGKRNAGLDA
jgi:hypothetical protein